MNPVKEKTFRLWQMPNDNGAPAALSKLIETAEPRLYAESITEFWESWLTHENETTPAERSHKLFIYKRLIEFFNDLEDS